MAAAAAVVRVRERWLRALWPLKQASRHGVGGTPTLLLSATALAWPLCMHVALALSCAAGRYLSFL